MKYSKQLLWALCLMLCASIIHAAPIKPGNWSMQTPSGEVFPVQVTLLKKGEYYFNALKHPISGVYKWDGKLFRIIKPDNPRMSGFVWRLERNHTLTMAEETPVPISGVKLI